MIADPRFSIIVYTNNPDHVSKLWKSLKQYAFQTSWELVVGRPAVSQVSAAWTEVEQFFSDIPNISFFDIDTPEEPTLNQFYNATIDKSHGLYLVVVPPGQTPTMEMLSTLDNLDVQNEADCILGQTMDANQEIFENSITSGLNLYYPNRVPRGLVIFKRATLVRLGGFNPKMQGNVGIHELTCRFYATSMKFRHISKPLTSMKSLEPAAEDKEALLGVSHQYFYRLVAEDALKRSLVNADFIRPDGTAIDKHEAIYWDGTELRTGKETGYRIEDSSYGVVRAADVLNAIPTDQVIACMEEIYRILVPDGWLISSTPSTSGPGAFNDPRSRSYWNSLSFSFYCTAKESTIGALFNGLFEHTRVWEDFPSAWHKDNGVSYAHGEIRKLPISIH